MAIIEGALGMDRLARDFGWRLVVLFGSLARDEEEARHADVAVMPMPLPSFLEQGHWLAALAPLFAPRWIDLLLITDRLSPPARFEVFRSGACLYEAEKGRFERERDRAFFLYADMPTVNPSDGPRGDPACLEARLPSWSASSPSANSSSTTSRVIQPTRCRGAFLRRLFPGPEDRLVRVHPIFLCLCLLERQEVHDRK